MDMFRCIHVLIAIALLLFTPVISNSNPNPNPASADANTIVGCIPSERSALVRSKSALSDPGGLLSSGKGDDCCQWKGVRCNNDTTGHVVELNLSGGSCNTVAPCDPPGPGLGGSIISPSLLGLKRLERLDLSCNNFSGRVPEFFGSLSGLVSLDLFQSTFAGMVPPQLGNLSNLRYFSLGSNDNSSSYYLYSTDVSWLARLSSLEYLDMSFVNLSTVVDWALVVNRLAYLRLLLFSGCQLSSSPGSLPYSNLTSLETLDLALDNINKRITPNWFWHLTSLKYLDISDSGFYGPFRNEIGNMTSIVDLSLPGNLVGMIPSSMNNLCNLERFDASATNINGNISELFKRLPRCSSNKLQDLFLPFCNLTGSLPTAEPPLSNLVSLDLRNNNLTGHVPLWLGGLTDLTYLDMSSNKLDGVIHEGHLSGLAMLDRLRLSDNLIGISVNSGWIPPFHLTEIQLHSCRLGPKFPTWLKWQTRVINLDISDTSISDIVPDWFWTTASSVLHLNMRNNQISGVLPSTMEFMGATEMDLSLNQFSGPIPKLPINLTDLNLCKNNLSGTLPSDLGDLTLLVLYGNSISGVIPSSLCKMKSLMLLDISGNRLTGPIPDCTVNPSSRNSTSLNIYNISLRNNKLSGKFPSFFKNCRNLLFLDLSYNQFSGALPAWIGKNLSSLVFLRLRSNFFSGHIPLELTRLVSLQYLDLEENNLSGSLPNSLANFNRMAAKKDASPQFFDATTYYNQYDGNILVDYTENITVVTKGQERLYTGEIIYMVNIDLSGNNLTGEIPEDVCTLVALTNLNLSWNRLSGQIPRNIGSLSQLESLDLSHNFLYGEIPDSISSLTYLSHMNLSYNNLSGRIPTGNQLNVLDNPASIYVGNIGLCGSPLPINCSFNGEAPPSIPKVYVDKLDKVSFLLGTTIGFLVGLLTILYLMVFSRRWRNTCYMFVDGLYDKTYVYIAIALRRL
uniref:non-specific serine/threonine protein kinase n=1 Tax=Oryza brachyantha TaxID=4533 RepID=J3L1M9_ORYBR